MFLLVALFEMDILDKTAGPKVVAVDTMVIDFVNDLESSRAH